jgi:hypothetical protein
MVSTGGFQPSSRGFESPWSYEGVGECVRDVGYGRNLRYRVHEAAPDIPELL